MIIYSVILPAEARFYLLVFQYFTMTTSGGCACRGPVKGLGCLILPLVCSVETDSGSAPHLSSSKLEEKLQEVAASLSCCASSAAALIVKKGDKCDAG